MAYSNKFIVCCNDQQKKGKFNAVLKDFVGANIKFYPGISLYKELREDPAHQKHIFINFDEASFKGLLMVREIRLLYPKTRFVAVKSQWQEATLKELFEHKVNGVATWNCGVEDLKYMVRSILKGNNFLSCDIINNAVNIFNNRKQNNGVQTETISKLSPQEKKIVHLLISGLSPKEISVHLEVKYETVRTHLKNIYKKLEVNSMLNAVIKIIKSDPSILY